MSSHSSEEEMDPYEEQDTPLLVEFSTTENEHIILSLY